MYTIFKDGGHQYQTEVERDLYVDVRDIEPGTDLILDNVLLISDSENDVLKVGQPNIEGAKIVAEVMCKAKGPKLVIRWFRRRKNSKKKTGHRQTYIKIKIKEIVAG